MAETNQFGLPLLSGSQAQKHVTVNEALAVLDAVTQLRVESANLANPPEGVAEGAAYVVAPGATGTWTGQDGLLAVCVNSGWRFLTPKAGWQAFSAETGTNQLYDGTDWLDSTMAATPSGSSTEYRIVELDHQLIAGATSETVPIIPANAMVMGVSGRVLGALTGTLADWRLGVTGSDNRYGSGLGKSAGSFVLGLTGSPMTYYADTGLLLTADGGEFAGGSVRLAVHFMTITPPR